MPGLKLCKYCRDTSLLRDKLKKILAVDFSQRSLITPQFFASMVENVFGLVVVKVIVIRIKFWKLETLHLVNMYLNYTEVYIFLTNSFLNFNLILNKCEMEVYLKFNLQRIPIKRSIERKYLFFRQFSKFIFLSYSVIYIIHIMLDIFYLSYFNLNNIFP